MALEQERTFVWDEKTGGFTTFQSYIPQTGLSINNRHITMRGGFYEHNSPIGPRNTFYGTTSNSEVELIFNEQPNSVKEYKTLNYEGSNGWTAEVSTDQESEVFDEFSFPKDVEVSDTINSSRFISKEGKHFADIRGDYTNFNDPDLTRLFVKGIGQGTPSSTDGQRGVITFAANLIPPDARASVTTTQERFPTIPVGTVYPGDRLYFYENAGTAESPSYGNTLLYAGEIQSIDRTANTISVSIPITPGTRTEMNANGELVPSNLRASSLIRSQNRVFMNISNEIQQVVFGDTDFTDSAVWQEQNTRRIDGSRIEYVIPTLRSINANDFFLLVKDEGVESGGLKGFFSIVKMINNNTTRAELFSVSSNRFVSTQ